MVDEKTKTANTPTKRRVRDSRVYRVVKRTIVAVSVFLVIAGVLGYFYEASERRRITTELPPPGKMVDVGGHSLHFRVVGEGSPTVILESGGGGGMLEWTLVAPEVAKVTRVVSYDRAGLGWSEHSPSPRTAEFAVDDLRAALEVQGIEGPLVLVGHSLGALYVRMYYSRHPEDVAGLVLVDGSHEEQRSRLPQEFQDKLKELEGTMAVSAKLATFGIPRILMNTQGVDDVFPELSLLPESQQSAWLQLAPGAALTTFVEELTAFDETCQQVKEAALTLDELPHTVISSGKPPFGLGESYKKAWMEIQAELAAMSKKGTHRVVEDSGHYIQIERPDVVVAEIVDMVQSIRNSTAEPE